MFLINEKDLLKKFFGYEHFRPGQEIMIQNILNGRDCLGIMPTGSGKSICYQIPAMLFSGVTIVISPLISLMKDQVDMLNDIGIPATFINSSLNHFEYEQTVENIIHGVYKIVYVAPERLVSPIFIKLLNSICVSMFAIDEAHCVSQWGHDFRPTYQEIANVVSCLNVRPVVSAFTATATQIVRDDIIHLLQLQDPFVLTTGFNRENLTFSIESPHNKLDYIDSFLKTHPNVSGIIYCLTRKNVDDLYHHLQKLGYSTSRYHAGMTDKQRKQSQEDFVYDRTPIMIATNAFGMGIDKSNVRYVIHYNMPKDLESYYQEAGRAGRDGSAAECILLFSRSDIVLNKFLIEQSNSPSLHKVEYHKLSDIIDYCHTDKCLRKHILEYFGEISLFNDCGNCSNCLSELEITDITSDAQKILSCIKRMHERFGIGLVTDVLKGSKSAKVSSFGFDQLSTYSIMKEYSKNTIKDLIYYLITEGYIDSMGDKFPVLCLSPLANRVLFDKEHVLIKKRIEKTEKSISVTDYDEKLFEILKQLRKEIAKTYQIPPFIVFSDATLRQMATTYPITAKSMLQVNGVGQNKLEKYGDIFISAILNYVSENNIMMETSS